MTEKEETEGRGQDMESPEEAGEPGGEAEVEEGSGTQGKRTSSRLWTPYSEPEGTRSEAPAEETRPGETRPEEDISEDELRQRLEEALEHITVAEVVIDFMVSMSSLAYRKMGIPHEVNEKHKDMEQARLAIDCVDALLKAAADRMPEEARKPLTGTLDNLKLNFAKES